MVHILYLCNMEEIQYIDDDWIAGLVEEARLYDGIEVDISWYKGAGWYDDYLRRIDGEA